MSWIRQGTISTTNGSTAVTGVDSLWSIGISPGASLYLVDGNGNPTEGPYEIAAINSNTSLTLAKPFPGTTGSARAYAIANTVGDQTVPDLANDLTQFYGEISELLDQPNTTPVANSIPVADSSGKIATGWLPNATTTTKGVVELATTAEAQAGTDATRAVTPATSGSRTTFAVTSTDDATSATAAPLKSAGGLAVAKDVRVGGSYYGRAAELQGRRFSFADIGDECIADTDILLKLGGGVFRIVVRVCPNPGAIIYYGNYQVGYIHTKNHYPGGILTHQVFFTGDKTGFDQGNGTNTSDFTVVPLIKKLDGTRTQVATGTIPFSPGETLSIKLDGVTGAAITTHGTFVEVTMISEFN